MHHWCVPTVGAEFVWRMEDLLDLYAESYDPAYPVVCFDECPVQLIAETQVPVPLAPGQPRRIDYAYRRAGTANLFVMIQPLAGWRHGTVTDQRTKQDFAAHMRDLVDIHFPTATLISVVLDTLNTHPPAALYATCAPAEARRIVDRLEFRYTPKHGSWLNMAEIERSVLKRQWLNRRIGDRDTLATVIATWEQQRNTAKAMIIWRFTRAQARVKLQRLYPSLP